MPVVGDRRGDATHLLTPIMVVRRGCSREESSIGVARVFSGEKRKKVCKADVQALVM